MAQLKAILNQLEMNLRNSGNRFQVAPQEEEEETERERREAKEVASCFFSRIKRSQRRCRRRCVLHK